MNPHKMSVVVFGAGIVCHGHIESFRSSSHTDVTCVVDINKTVATEIARKYDIPNTETDYRTAIAKYKPEIVLVATPHYLHHPMVIDSLKSGCHVICEKPLAMTVSECDDMIAAAEKHDRRLFVAHNMRAMPQFRKIKQLIDSQRLGRVFLADFQYLGYEVARLNETNNWKGTKDMAGGGVLLDGGYHMVDLVNYYFGMPKTVKAVMQRSVVTAENKEEDNALLLAEYPDKLIANVVASFSAKTEGSERGATLMLNVSVYGTKGTVHGGYNSSRAVWELKLVENDVEKPCDLSDIGPLNIDHHFIDCILNNTTPIVTAHQARDTVAIIEKAYQQK